MTKQKFGLTGTALKTIALVLMVMDHIHYFFEFTGVVPEWFSMLARLSAPLFLFCTVEGFAHTHDRRRYFLRIWAIGTAMGTVEFFMIYAGAFRRGDGFYPLNAIFQDLMLLCILWQGFDAWVESDVLPGSGLSSSAAFEVLLGRIGSALFAGGSLTPVEIAQMAQWAENVYFGKPCGLMDQLASSTGGLVFMDFRDPAAPEVRRLNAALPGYALCIVDSGADHADLTAQYAAIPRDLKAVCRLFDAEVLRQVDEDAFYRRLPEVRRLAGDRAVLRAIHVFDENRRVLAQVRALESGDVPGFLSLINASGASSWEYLQNIAPAGAAKHQALAVTLALCRRMLRGQGAVRVHGGGFAGTALCIVPEEKLSAFCRELETHLAPGCCHRLQIR